MWFGKRDIFRFHALRWARLFVFVSCVAAVAGFLLYRKARADFSEQLMRVGDGLMRYAGARHEDGTRVLELNGQHMFFRTANTENSLDDVLDYFERKCTEHDGQIEQYVQELERLQHQAVSKDTSAVDTTLRKQTAEKGFVACLDMGPSKVEMNEFSERLQQFNLTGDLSSLGGLRYAYASQHGKRVQIVAFWTQGTFNVYQMFPTRGDAEGIDFPGVPRPAGSKRILSSSENGHEQLVVMYQGGPVSFDAREHFYNEELVKHGWSPLTTANAPKQGDVHSLTFEKDKQSVTLVFSSDARGALTVVLGSR